MGGCCLGWFGCWWIGCLFFCLLLLLLLLLSFFFFFFFFFFFSYLSFLFFFFFVFSPWSFFGLSNGPLLLTGMVAPAKGTLMLGDRGLVILAGLNVRMCAHKSDKMMYQLITDYRIELYNMFKKQLGQRGCLIRITQMLWGATFLMISIWGVLSSCVDTTWVRSFSKRATIPLFTPPHTFFSAYIHPSSPWKWKMAPSNSCGILQINRHFRRNHDSGRKSMPKQKEYTVHINIYIYMYIYIYIIHLIFGISQRFFQNHDPWRHFRHHLERMAGNCGSRWSEHWNLRIFSLQGLDMSRWWFIKKKVITST